MYASLKKKRNIIIATVCMVVCFILYQLYFFLTITREAGNGRRVVPVYDHLEVKDLVHLRSEADKHINDHGAIRGVLHTNMLRYRPDGKDEFKCLKSEQYIPFAQLNDDYCDCEDGTDEPSTSACVNGTFFCDMQYQRKPVSINSVPSSRVNDGICDCCDGSDEWDGGLGQKLLSQSSAQHYRHYVTKCPNIC